jgi:hypothetical protein
LDRSPVLLKERPAEEKKKGKNTCETQESNARYFSSFGKEKRKQSGETCHERCRGVLEFFCVCVCGWCACVLCVKHASNIYVAIFNLKKKKGQVLLLLAERCENLQKKEEKN